MRLGCYSIAALVIVGLVLFGQAQDAVRSMFGTGAAQVFAYIGWAAIIGLFLWLSVTGYMKRRQAAQRIVESAERQSAGPFEQWFRRQTQWTRADRIPVGVGKDLVYKAYGGRGVVGVLFKEGFTALVANDLVKVLGSERGQLVFANVFNDVNDGGLLADVLGFVAGFQLAGLARRR